jgi:hypothetical protein
MKIIALEESFWYEKLATEGSTVSHVRVKSAVAADWQRKLVDFTEYRLPDMDRNGVDMPAADDIIASSRRRLLALIRARDADGAGREMEQHLEGLSWTVERRCVSVRDATL